MRLTLVAGSVFVLLALVRCSAQVANGNAFDISSVKPVNGDFTQGAIKRLDLGIMSVSAMTVKEVVELVYYVRPYQIAGGPDWMSRDRFDITGKDSTATSSGQKPDDAAWAGVEANDMQRMRELLSSRFGLKLHHETRTVGMLSLLIDGHRKFRTAPCSTTYRLQHGTVQGAIHISSLAALVKAELGTPVRDDTGLRDCYSLDAHWTTDSMDETLPSLPAALHDLGFKLKRIKGQVDILVIDSLQRPKPD